MPDSRSPTRNDLLVLSPSRTAFLSSKFELIRHLDVYVDDNLEEIIKSSAIVSHPIVLDRPWNRTNDLSGIFHRAHSWPELVRVIENLS